MVRQAVIVVEDEPLLRADAAVLLDEAGLDVLAFDSADEALDCIATSPEGIAAVFTDVRVAGDKDGLELARIVALRWPNITVLVTSGLVDHADPLPNVRFLRKPWRPLEVLTAIQNAVG